MSFNVLITYCGDEEWIKILQNLEEKCDWKIRYMVGWHEIEEKVRNSFPGVLYEDIGAFLAGRECFGKEIAESDEISALPEKPFEFDLLEKLSKYEFMAKYIINRNYEKGSDRTNEIYFDLINYWLKILDFTKPSLIIVPWSPYTSREYVLYALSQILDIKFLTFRQTSVFYLNIPVSNIDSPFLDDVVFQYEHMKTIQPLPSKLTDIKIQKHAMQRIEEIMNLNSKNILTDYEKNLKSSTRLNKLVLISDHSLNTLNYIKEEGKVKFSNILTNKFGIKKSIEFLFHTPKILIITIRDELKSHINTLRGVKKLKALKRVYDSHCVEPDYNRPYIFFPLHYQPEQTTAPFGNYAVYQYLPIEMIARSLPDNWMLYVKEHHTMFTIHGSVKMRTKEYFERISKIPNVALIPIETQSAVLIDNSKAIATITGSAGYEGVLRGKPVLTFGSAWYNGCEGVFHIQNHNECKEVIEKIRLGIKVNSDQMLLFVQATEAIGAKVNFSRSMKNFGDESITIEETISNMTECISNWWEKKWC